MYLARECEKCLVQMKKRIEDEIDFYLLKDLIQVQETIRHKLRTRANKLSIEAKSLLE